MVCGTVQYCYAVGMANIGKRGLGFEHGDYRLLAACDHRLPEAAEIVAKGVAAAGGALLFLSNRHRDDLVVHAFLGDGARTGRITVGPDAAAGVRSRLEQQPRHLDVALHHPDVEGAYFEAGRSSAQQIDDFRPPRKKRPSRA